jgi:hypothetical protein
MKLLISILESIYLSYMFHFFKTGMDFNILSSPKGFMLGHLIGDSVGKRICLFGQIAIIPLIILLLIRNITPIPDMLIQVSLGIALLLSTINLNALVYLLPVFLLEIILYFR